MPKVSIGLVWERGVSLPLGVRSGEKVSRTGQVWHGRGLMFHRRSDSGPLYDIRWSSVGPLSSRQMACRRMSDRVPLTTFL